MNKKFIIIPLIGGIILIAFLTIFSLYFPNYSEDWTTECGTIFYVSYFDKKHHNVSTIQEVLNGTFDEDFTLKHFKELDWGNYSKIGIPSQEGISTITIPTAFTFGSSPYNKIIEVLSEIEGVEKVEGGKTWCN